MAVILFGPQCDKIFTTTNLGTGGVSYQPFTRLSYYSKCGTRGKDLKCVIIPLEQKKNFVLFLQNINSVQMLSTYVL